jgi:hypothetical protein
MNRESLWPTVCDRALMDRESFLEAWSGTGDNQVKDDINAEIARFRLLKGKTLKESMAADREGVRLAMLSAECWYLGTESAQVGREKKHAAAMYKRVHEVRSKLFGRTKLESMIANSVSVPLHKVKDLIKVGLDPN